MLLTRLSKLCTLDGVSGCEGAVREYILSEVRPYADEVRVDSMGNVMALRRGRKMGGKCLMLAAHMDEVGFIVKRITDEGMLKFGVVGGMYQGCSSDDGGRAQEGTRGVGYVYRHRSHVARGCGKGRGAGRLYRI